MAEVCLSGDDNTSDRPRAVRGRRPWSARAAWAATLLAVALSMEPSAKEIAAVSLLAGAERYRYFVKKVCDAEELWSLRDNGGWCVAGDGKGREGIPVWSSRAFAELCAHGTWASSSPESI